MKIWRQRIFVLASLFAFVGIISAALNAQDDGDAWAKKKSSWLLLTPAQHAQVQEFAEDYKGYLDVARTALLSTREVIRRARTAGFVEFTNPDQVKPGARLIVPNRERSVILAVIGSDPIVDGSHVVGTHQDSPHIELKPRPIYPAGGFALFKTKYYGGIKKYQWANIPLALVGRIDTEDGRTINVSVGLNPGDPVFVIPDAAPHSDSELRTRTYTNVLQGEELEPVIGSIPGEKDSVAVAVTQLLTSTYKIKEEDLVSAELALVPAAHPADVGFDRGLVGAYGQDDRVSTYCATRAIIDLKGTPKFTALAYVSNFEEVGSVNNTGAGSQFLSSTFARLIGAQRGSAYNDHRPATRPPQFSSHFRRRHRQHQSDFPFHLRTHQLRPRRLRCSHQALRRRLQSAFRIYRQNSRPARPQRHSLANAHVQSGRRRRRHDRRLHVARRHGSDRLRRRPALDAFAFRALLEGR